MNNVERENLYNKIDGDEELSDGEKRDAFNEMLEDDYWREQEEREGR